MDRNEQISFPFNIFATKGRKLKKKDKASE